MGLRRNQKLIQVLKLRNKVLEGNDEERA